MNKQETIDNIIDNFQFDRVHSAMIHLNWCWASVAGMGDPTKEELVADATKKLNRMYDDATPVQCTISSGGLKVISELDPTTGKVYLELVFELTSWDNYD